MASFSFAVLVDTVSLLTEFLVLRPAARSAKVIGPDRVGAVVRQYLDLCPSLLHVRHVTSSLDT
jgi:hypothetical protein